MKLKEFREFFCKDQREDKRFCFILGAGASKQSGIPTGSELVQRWMKEMQERLDQIEINEWIKKENIDPENPARDYPKIYAKRFCRDPRDGYECLEKAMDGREPSCGYSVLAQILAEGHHNIVITTNFDSLTEDALFIYTKKKPLVVGHEALANFIKPFMKRPIIVKIHRDLLFEPKSGEEETSVIAGDLKENLTGIFEYYTPIVIGYGGNDGSLMGFLKELDNIKNGIYWCYRESSKTLDQRIVCLIEQFDGFGVQIPGFDEVMLQFGAGFGFSPLGDKIIELAEERSKKYKEQYARISEAKSVSRETKEAASSIASRGKKDWWYYEMMVRKEQDIEKSDQIYREGIKENPKNAALFGNYAIFLEEKRNSYDKAEEYYLKALEIDPEDANNIGNYASFLADRRNSYEKAEDYYLKALEINPKHANNIGNFAKLLIKKRNLDGAKKLIQKAFYLNKGEGKDLELEIWFYRYAVFLKDYPEADKEIEKLLAEGITSPGWYLDDVLEVAKEQGHPDFDKLKEYADKISAI